MTVPEGVDSLITVPEGVGSNTTNLLNQNMHASASSTHSNITMHSGYNNTEHTDSTSTNGSSTVHSATNITQATSVPKETVNEEATPTEAMVVQTAPVLDDSRMAASEGAPDSKINDMPNKYQNSGSQLGTK
jgi:hypothetical protein